MSGSHKARYTTRGKVWKDTVYASRAQARARAKRKQREEQRRRTQDKRAIRKNYEAES